jgi:hypothetical protein
LKSAERATSWLEAVESARDRALARELAAIFAKAVRTARVNIKRLRSTPKS